MFTTTPSPAIASLPGAVLLSLAIALPGAALGVRTEVRIPGEDWAIRFESPRLADQQESKRNSDYAFRASSGRFNLSLFVETPAGTETTSQACYESYWAHASKGPMIAQETVRSSKTPKFVRVRYELVAEFQGQLIRSRNVNYYFAFRGKCVDVHISVIEPTEVDAAVFEAFDDSLDYGP